MPDQVNYGDPDPNYYAVAHGQLLASYSDLLKKVQDQNAKLDEQIKRKSQDHSTDYKKAFYENESAEYLRTIYTYLLYIYIFFAVIVIMLMIFTGQIIQPRMLILAILLILFPYFIYPLENILYTTFMWIYSLIMDKVFKNPYLSTTAV